MFYKHIALTMIVLMMLDDGAAIAGLEQHVEVLRVNHPIPKINSLFFPALLKTIGFSVRSRAGLSILLDDLSFYQED